MFKLILFTWVIPVNDVQKLVNFGFNTGLQ
jgi:hypothetical protein